MVLRWSSSTSAFTSCQCDATIPNTCSISHMLSTSDFYLSNKSFQPSPLSQSQHGSVLPGISRLQWVMFIRAVSESLRLSPIPSSEKNHQLLLHLHAVPGWVQQPAGKSVLQCAARSHLPPADPTPRRTTSKARQGEGRIQLSTITTFNLQRQSQIQISNLSSNEQSQNKMFNRKSMRECAKQQCYNCKWPKSSQVQEEVQGVGVEWRWSSSTSAFSSCQHVCTTNLSVDLSISLSLQL